MILKIITIIFIATLMYNVYCNYRERKISHILFLVFNTFFIGVLLVTCFERISITIAKLIGMGRGLDALLSLGLLILLYLVLYLYLKLKKLENQLVEFVQKDALGNNKR